MTRLACLITLTLGLALAAPATAATYSFDTVHSQVGFKVRHLGVSWVRGTFTDWTGSIEFDDANPADAAIAVTIQAASVDTGNEKRDDHLRSDDFLNAELYPEMTFVSTRIENLGPDSFDLVGDLTIRNVTKEVVFAVSEVTPEVAGPGGSIRRGAVATTAISREEYGTKFSAMVEGTGLVVGDEVIITIELELVKLVEGA